MRRVGHEIAAAHLFLVGQRDLGVVAVGRLGLVPGACPRAFGRHAGVLRHAAAQVATEVAHRIARLPAHARDGKEVLEAVHERRHLREDDGPAVGGLLGGKGRRTLFEDAHEEGAAEEGDAVVHRVGVRDELDEVVQLGLGVVGVELEYVEDHARVRVGDGLVAQALQGHVERLAPATPGRKVNGEGGDGLEDFKGGAVHRPVAEVAGAHHLDHLLVGERKVVLAVVARAIGLLARFDDSLTRCVGLVLGSFRPSRDRGRDSFGAAHAREVAQHPPARGRQDLSGTRLFI